jgi:hypothetical protein
LKLKELIYEGKTTELAIAHNALETIELNSTSRVTLKLKCPELKNLDIQLPFLNIETLFSQKNISNFQKLATLKIINGKQRPKIALPADGFHLPALKSLQVTNFTGTMILSNMPLLQKLTLEEMYKLNLNMIADKSHTECAQLESLEIDSSTECEDGCMTLASNSLKIVRIHCPSFKYDFKLLLGDLPVLQRLAFKNTKACIQHLCSLSNTTLILE